MPVEGSGLGNPTSPIASRIIFVFGRALATDNTFWISVGLRAVVTNL